MATNLLIVESPSKAKTLKKYLGKDFTILASYGHIRDLVPKQGAVDPEAGFAMKYELITRNRRHADAIAEAALQADTIYLATDPDREGEAIAWHIAQMLHLRHIDKPLRRVVFHEITQSAVQAGVAHPRDIAGDLVNAQQARRALDYLVGFNLSPLLWKKIRRGLSAGRVQSPALRMIVEREVSIRAFESEEYWSVHLQALTQEQQPVNAKLWQYRGQKVGQFTFRTQAEQAHVVAELTQAAQGAVRVGEIEKKRKQRHAAAPFTTSTLQQEAVRKLGFSTDRTMRLAQQLYEGIDIGQGTVGLITYMRTDSVHLAQEAVAELRQYIGEHFSADYLPSQPNRYNSKAKNAQEAHEAIRPTSIDRTPASMQPFLSAEAFKLYDMIWKRTLAAQMTAAQFDTVAAELWIDPIAQFRATGQTLVFPGFMAVYQEDVDDAQAEQEGQLPLLVPHSQLMLANLFGEQHFTQPPPRYSEASLVKALEEYGIGRPSTYASIISTLLDREYVELDKKRFVPTDVGEVVNKFLTEHFTRYVDYGFTADLEDQLDRIANGEQDWLVVLGQFWEGFHQLVAVKQDLSRAEVTQEKLDEACPKCGGELTIRLGRRGRFVGCANYPTCDYTRNLDGSAEETPESKVLGIDPSSQEEILLLKGPYGYYVQRGHGGEVDAKGKAIKPKRASWWRDFPLEQADLATALQLLALPRELGLHPLTGKKVVANIGRFGPYVGHNSVFKSIPKGDSVFTLSFERALELLAEAEAKNVPLRVVGMHPSDGEPIQILRGRYGPYLKHGKVKVTVPAADVEHISLEQAVERLQTKAEKSTKASTRSRKPSTRKASV